MLPKNHIRIVDLLPSGSDDLKAPIKCVTRIVALSDEPVYEALSYRWGTHRGRRFIYVGGELTSVTASLHAALFRLRHHTEKRALWIDQICINQEDTDEKEYQMRLMGHVYSHCTRCLVWLGEVDSGISLEDANGALAICAYLADGSLPIPDCFQSPDAVLGATKALSSISPKEHLWWHRAWTVQETILPSSKSVVWGPLELDWEVLDQLANNKTTLGSRWASIAGELMRAGKTESEAKGMTKKCLGVLATNVLSVSHANGDTGPITTILKCRRRGAAYPQDKVFGLLGLLPSDMPLPHTDKCNHTTPTNRVYRGFTLDVMLYTKSLEALVIEPRTSPAGFNPGLPGWAIDMDCVEMFAVDPYYRARGCGKGRYDACAGRKLDTATLLETAAVPEYHLRVLGLSGVMVDTVEVIRAGFLLGSQKPPLEEMATVLRRWMEMARRFQESLNGGLKGDEFEEAFYRVLVGDSIRDSNQDVERPPNQEDLAAVSKFVKTGNGLINGLSWWPEYTGNQTFFITKGGMMGLGHRETEPGDEIWIFDGGPMPFAIRPKKTAKIFDFVGCCYAHNIMKGEGYTDEIISTSQRIVHLH